MAGIQIPKVERFQPQPMDSVVDTKVNIPDMNKGADLQMKAVSNIVEDQADYYLKQERAAVDTASKAAANEYNIYLNAELNNAKIQQGDPTQAYSQFNEKMNGKYDEILNKNPNLSEAGKASVKAALADVYTNYSMKSNTAYSGQYFDYDTQVTEDAVKITAQDFMTASSYIDPQDEKSFQAIDSLINRIGNLYKSHGEKFGAVTRDENGNQVATDGINLKIAKATSEGLKNTIENLNTSGRPDLAEAVYAKYYKYIDEKSQDNVIKSIGSKKDKIEVAQTVNEVRGKSVESIDKYLNKKFKDRPDLKDKAFDEIAARSNKEKTIRENQSAQATDRAIVYVKQAMSAAQKAGDVYDLTSMENDPVLQKIMGPVTDHKDRKAIEQIISSPKTTDPKVMTKFNELLSSGDIRNVSAEQLEKVKVGMNPSDRAKVDNWWRRFNATETLPQEKALMSEMTKRLEKTMQDQGYVKTKTKFSPWSRQDEKRFNDAFIELGNSIDNYKGLPLTEAYKRVDEMVTRKVKGIITEEPVETVPKSTSAGLGKIITLSDRKQIYSDLRARFKGRGPTDKEIQDEFNRRNQ